MYIFLQNSTHVQEENYTDQVSLHLCGNRVQFIYQLNFLCSYEIILEFVITKMNLGLGGPILAMLADSAPQVEL